MRVVRPDHGAVAMATDGGIRSSGSVQQADAKVLLLFQEKIEPSKHYRRASGHITLARLVRAQVGRFHLRWRAPYRIFISLLSVAAVYFGIPGYLRQPAGLDRAAAVRCSWR